MLYGHNYYVRNSFFFFFKEHKKEQGLGNRAQAGGHSAQRSAPAPAHRADRRRADLPLLPRRRRRLPRAKGAGQASGAYDTEQGASVGAQALRHAAIALDGDFAFTRYCFILSRFTLRGFIAQ